MGDVDHRGAEIVVKLGDFEPHLHAQFRVEVGQRLVEQEHLRLAHDRAADGDALALAAGHGGGLAVEQRAELRISAAFCTRSSICLARARSSSDRSHVVVHRHVRIERVGLEHHRDATLGGSTGDVASPISMVPDVSPPDPDKPQQGGLAAAGRADENDEFAIVDLQVNALDDMNVAKGFFDIGQRYRAISLPPACPWCAISMSGAESRLQIFLDIPGDAVTKRLPCVMFPRRFETPVP